MAKILAGEGLAAVEVRQPPVRRDERGWLVETLRADWVGSSELGQFFVTAAKPGAVKGNHYHHYKREWFCVIHGQAELVLEDVRSRERKVLHVEGKAPTLVSIPPFVSHGIRNTGRGWMYLLVYSGTVFDPSEPDTYPHVVLA
jgi:dTDP-4-dehydrorhamnose 3,5-epimerase-like enzyme